MLKGTRFVTTLVELADTLVADFDVVELLSLLADRCVEVLDVGAAGLMLLAPDGDLRVMASSSEAMRVLELFELQAQEGPCLDCYRSGRAVVGAKRAHGVAHGDRRCRTAARLGHAGASKACSSVT
jgi:GAF domain-containing protein